MRATDAQWDFCLISGISPTVVFDRKIEESILVGMEAASAGERKAARRRLFMTAGRPESDSWGNAIVNFQNALESRRYPGLVIKTIIIEGEGHSGQKAEAYNRGLRFVFEK